jgi:hypothetical protein
MHKMKEQRATATLSRAGMKCDSVVLAINLAPIKPSDNPSIKQPKQWPPDFPSVISTLRELRGSQEDPEPRLVSRSNSRRAVAARAAALHSDPANGSRAATSMAQRPSSASSTFMQSLALSSLSDPFLAAVSASARSAAQANSTTPSRSQTSLARGTGANNGGDGVRITPLHNQNGALRPVSLTPSASEPFLTPTRATNRWPRGHHSIGNTPDMTSTSRSVASSNQLPVTPHTPGAGGMLYMSTATRTLEEKEARDASGHDDEPPSPNRRGAITFNLNDTPTNTGKLRPRTTESNHGTRQLSDNSIREEDESQGDLEVRLDDGSNSSNDNNNNGTTLSLLTPASTRGHMLTTSTRLLGSITPDPVRSHSKRLWEHTLGNSYSVPDLHASRRTPTSTAYAFGAPPPSSAATAAIAGSSPNSPQPPLTANGVRSSAPPVILLPPSMEKMNSVDVLLMGGHARSLSRASSIANPSTPSHHHSTSSFNLTVGGIPSSPSMTSLSGAVTSVPSSSSTILPPLSTIQPARTPDPHARSLSSIPPSVNTARGDPLPPPGSAGSMAVAAVLALGAATVASPTPSSTRRRPFQTFGHHHNGESDESIAIARRADLGVSGPAAEQHPPMARMAGGYVPSYPFLLDNTQFQFCIECMCMSPNSDINDASVMLRRFHPSRKATITSPVLATLRKAHPQLQTDYRTQFSAALGSPPTPSRRPAVATGSSSPAKKKSLTFQPT